MVTELAVAPLFGMPEGAPEQLDARCARLAFHWDSPLPACCARGARIDARARITVVQLLPELKWSEQGPMLDGEAPSGVVERLVERAWSSHVACCDALDEASPDGGVRGDGCLLRKAARARDLREDVFLLPGCALFPLEIVGGVLVPSSRIPASALVAVAEGARSLWDEARDRFALRFGDVAEGIVDAAARTLRAHRGRGLHLKTVR